MKKILTILVGVLCPIYLIGGISSLQKYSGFSNGRVISIALIEIACILSLYLFYGYRVKSVQKDEERSKYLFQALGCAAFVLGGVLIMVTTQR